MNTADDWGISYSEDAEVPVAAIWAAMSDVGSWPAWNDDIESIAISGPFEVGATIAMRPRGQDTVLLRLTQVEPGACFIDEAEVAGTLIRTHHEVASIDDGRVRITYRLHATGPLAVKLGPAISGDFAGVIHALIAHAARCGAGAPHVTGGPRGAAGTTRRSGPARPPG